MDGRRYACSSESDHRTVKHILPDEILATALHTRISSFNFTEVANTILDEITTKQPNLNRDDLEVLFFENESDRDATINTIITIDNYRNADRDNQIIYVKINNKMISLVIHAGCYGGDNAEIFLQ